MDGGPHPAPPSFLPSPVYVLLDSSLWVRYRFPLRLLHRFTTEEEVYTLRVKEQKFKGKNMKRRWKRLRRLREETFSAPRAYASLLATTWEFPPVFLWDIAFFFFSFLPPFSPRYFIWEEGTDTRSTRGKRDKKTQRQKEG